LEGIVPNDKLVPNQAPSIPEDILRIFGDPPLLSTENRELYLTLLCMVAQELRPRNIIEWLSLKDVVDLSWEIRRLRRFKALSIEEGRRSRFEPPFRPKPLSEGDLLFSSILGPPPTPPSEADIRRENRQRARRNARLQTEIGSTIVFEETITMYERIDRLLVSAELRRSALLHDMKFYREDLAHLLKDSSTKIIDGEFTETAVPSA